MYVKTMRSMSLVVVLTSSVVLTAPKLEAAEGESTVVVRVPAASVADASALGVVPKRAYDYGSFQWLELSSDDFDRLVASNAKFRIELRRSQRPGGVSCRLGKQAQLTSGAPPDGARILELDECACAWLGWADDDLM